MLLAVWHDLSDVKLAQALDDRTSFWRFCGFSTDEVTPERTAFVRLRRQLVARGLDKVVFEEVTRQIKVKAVTVKTGTLIDATVIASAAIMMTRQPGPVELPPSDRTRGRLGRSSSILAG